MELDTVVSSLKYFRLVFKIIYPVVFSRSRFSRFFLGLGFLGFQSTGLVLSTK